MFKPTREDNFLLQIGIKCLHFNMYILTSSAIDKKLKIDKKLENYKNIQIKRSKKSRK